MSESGGTEDTIKKTLLDRIEKLYQFSEQQAPARVWQKIYKQVIKKLIIHQSELLKDSRNSSVKRRRATISPTKSPGTDRKNPALIEQALQSVKKKTPEGQWDLLLQMGGHLRALKSESRMNIPVIIMAKRSEHSLMSRNHWVLVRNLNVVLLKNWNNPNYYQRNKLVISDYVKEVNIVKASNHGTFLIH